MYEHLYIMLMVFTVVFIATMSILKLKYKTMFDFTNVAKISSITGIVVYIAVLAAILIIVGIPQTKYPGQMIAATIGELIGWLFSSVIYGVILYAVARYVIVKPIRYLSKKVKKA